MIFPHSFSPWSPTVLRLMLRGTSLETRQLC